MITRLPARGKWVCAVGAASLDRIARMESFYIHVAKDYLNFCAGHFITYDGHQCEALHGHNYRVRITLAGPLDENHYVVDFVRLKKMLKRLCDDLDHRVLLAAHNPHLQVEHTPTEVTVRYAHRRYVFPVEDVVVLPIANTTAELLAHYLNTRARAELPKLSPVQCTRVEVEVEETPGQAGVSVWVSDT